MELGTTFPRRSTSVRVVRKGRRRLARAATYLVLIVWTFICVFPVAWIYLQSFKTPLDTFAVPPKFVFEPTLHNYQVVLGLERATEVLGGSASTAAAAESRLPRYLLNSVIVSVGTVGLAVVLATLAAYPLARMRVRGKWYWMTGIVASRMVPPVVLVLPLYVLWRSLSLTDTHLGLILVYLPVILPFGIWLLHGFLLDIPIDIEEAAMVEGCSRLGAFARVTLPLAAPGLAVTAILLVLSVWNEFLFAAMLTSENAKTLTPSITVYLSDQGIKWGQLYAASGLMLLPVIVFSLLVQKHIAGGLTGGAVKG